MYELQQQEQKDKWKKYNEATKMVLEKRFSEASVLIKDFKEKNPNDLPWQNLLKKCLERLFEQEITHYDVK